MLDFLIEPSRIRRLHDDGVRRRRRRRDRADAGHALLFADSLGKRMKAVAVEREKIRQRERERMAQDKQKVSLRQSPKQYMQTIVERVQSDQMGRPGRGAAASWCRPAIAARRPTSPICFSAWSRRSRPSCSRCSICSSCSNSSSRRRVKLAICIAAAYVGMHAAADAAEKQDPEAAAVDQARFPRHARSAADLRGIRHVDRGRIQEGERGNRLAIDARSPRN